MEVDRGLSGGLAQPIGADGKRAADARWLGGLPRRDLVVLPLVALATLIVLVALSEVGARLYAPAHEKLSCVAFDTRLGLGHGRPHCTETGKIPEGPRVVYAYNECGYRSTAPCGAKPAGTLRIAILGASFAEGYVVPYDETFAARAERRLAALCGSPVEIENLAALGTNLVGVYRRLDEALALRPDVIIIAVLPFDIEDGLPPEAVERRNAPPGPQPAAQQERPLVARVALLTKSSRALTVARHFLFADRALYLKSYLLSGDTAGFLRVSYTPAWEQRMADLDLLLGEMAAKSRAAGAQLALLLGPQRAQVALMASGHWPAGVDPYALPRRLKEITAKHGATLIDSTKAFARLKRPEELIYTVDGHPGGAASGLIADALVQQLVTDQRSPFAGCKNGISAR
jgi:hypothetical protein